MSEVGIVTEIFHPFVSDSNIIPSHQNSDYMAILLYLFLSTVIIQNDLDSFAIGNIFVKLSQIFRKT